MTASPGMRRISVVLPVYNESESIAPCLRGLERALAGEDHEILVCYDTEEDTTLPAIAAMPDRPASVRLVRNTRGRGALNAIVTGFAASQGDVVVTSMADLSDPPEAILGMAKAIREGADVVSGSRYMRGGSQKGGPWLKRTLSRLAGLSLHRLAGVGTRDATSNFRGYSRAFLDTVEVESRGGFEIALELTVKAHLAGRRVTEVPSSWVDRSSGKSNFRLWRWMPSYLRWYLRATGVPLALVAVWLAATATSIAYVARYASPVPIGDDLEMARAFAGRQALSPAWIWTQHNEHRIPVARLVFLGLMRLFGDVRSGMLFQVAVLALVALAAMLAARRVRGRSSLADLFFPLLLQHTGNSFNLLMGFQLAVVLPVALLCTIPLLLASGPAQLSPPRAIGIGLCVLLLPLQGGPGLSQVPPIAAWLVAAGASARDRTSGRTMLALGIGALALLSFYFVGFQSPPGHVHSPGLGRTLEVAGQLAALAVGPAAVAAWPVSGVLVGLVVLATAGLLAAEVRSEPAERVRASGLLACLLAPLALSLAVGFGRGGEPGDVGFASRYVTWTAPLLLTAFLAWLRYARTAMPAFLACAAATSLPANVRAGSGFGREHAALAGRIDAAVREGASIPAIAERFGEELFSGPDAAADRLEALHTAGLPPFRGRPYAGNAPPPERAFGGFATRPEKVVPPRPLLSRVVDSERVFLAFPPHELWFRAPPGARRITGRFGMLPDVVRRGRSDGVRFSVEKVAGSSPPVVLFERFLDPRSRAEDRGPQALSVDLAGADGASIVLRTSNPPEKDDLEDWAYWTGVGIE
jgi:hypothetical protein